MKDYFKPKDFLDTKGCQSYPVETIASIANEKLNALIGSMPVVYSYNGEDDWFFPTKQDYPNVTHMARIAFIQEIVKKPCEHVPYVANDNIILTTYPAQYPEPIFKCKRCNVELKAEWSAK